MQSRQQLSFSFHQPPSTLARPFLKWAGGKTQLLDQIEEFLPASVKDGTTKRYIEPFIGGGAVFFYIAQTYPISELFILDRNNELILAYRTIKYDVDNVIDCLQSIQDDYHQLKLDQQEQYYYEIRDDFNNNRTVIDYYSTTSIDILRTAQIIFMNRTCFNGLFRVNSKGEFNVPFGRYKHPTICDADNLQAVANVLQRTEICLGDFEICRSLVNSETFVYFDPPYRPISKTASFNSYAKDAFDDSSQERLARFYRELDGMGAQLMLSNSDPHNEDPDDNFFQLLYHDFNIHKVFAKRAINSDGARRGEITELLITNYS